MATSPPLSPPTTSSTTSESLTTDGKSPINTATDRTETSSICSEGSTILDGSVVSTLPDRYGFLGGQQYTATEQKKGPSAKTILRRERKWLRMLMDWEMYMTKNYKRVNERCHKGIPMSIRPKAWLYLCGGQIFLERNPGVYENLIRLDGDPKWVDDIKKDLHRQFPQHEMFVSEDKPGQKELFNVLKAYSIRNPEVGFCQAQAPVAAFLLMHMPAEQAFWCLVSVCDNYLSGYYSPGLEVIQRDGDMLHGLLKRTCAPAYKHLVKHNIDPILYMTEWFLCGFTRTLPWDALLRMWDIFLCEGVKVLFKIALVILAGCLASSKMRKRHAGQCETLQLLRNPPREILEEDYLLSHMERLSITEEDFQLEDEKQTARRKAQKLADSARYKVNGKKR